MDLKIRSHRRFVPVTIFSLVAVVVIAAVVSPLGRSITSRPSASTQSTSIVISQVYGGGGNGGSTYKNDFIELFNLGSTTVSVTGWSVQYASSGGPTWQVTSLSGSIGPGQYYLVQEAAGAGGTINLPPPDANGSIAMSLSNGKVALVSSTTALGGGCPTGGSLVDFVGYGGSASCFEGSGPTTTLTNTTSASRDNNGCTDTDNNAADLTAGSVNPRNSASPLNNCGNPTPSPTPTVSPTPSPSPGVACAAPSPPPNSCGVERWSVKTGTDPNVGSVNLNSATPTTIANLRSFPYPSPNPPANGRVAPYETTQWVINGTLVEYKLENDSDYHVVVQDGAGNTMVTEIPYPGASPPCVSVSSPFQPGIAAARCKFDSRFSVTGSFQFANVPVRVTGIGMFDFPHGQTGAAPNQMELHPIIDIAFPVTTNAATGTGTNVNVQNGDASITFSAVTSGGTTTAQPIDPSTAGTPPSGFMSTGPALNISTTATVSGPISVCVSVPSVTDLAAFARFKILHNEGGVLIDRTTSVNPSGKLVCGNVASLSPFVVALGPVPTAAPGSISGLITTPDLDPLEGAVITLSGSRSARTITNYYGSYFFHDLDVEGFYTVTPSRANYSFTPASRAFSLLGSNTDAAFNANPDVAQSANAIDTAEYFVRQQYLDFLDREPDQGGFAYWSDQVNQCNGDANCIHNKRIDVSAAFFASAEFQQTGSYIYGLYAGTLGRTPDYGEFMPDRSQVLGGSGLEQAKTAFAQSFVQRNQFTSRYPQSMSREQFVDAVLQTMTQRSGVNHSALRDGLLSDYDTGGRALVARHASEASAFINAEYKKAFVLMEYFGYLRRDIDQSGYDFWLYVLNRGADSRGMVCAFLTSTEYQRRFSTVVTRSNAECGN
jgi:Lamin Tail Domain/Domain of unknown function (DUF4214)